MVGQHARAQMGVPEEQLRGPVEPLLVPRAQPGQPEKPRAVSKRRGARCAPARPAAPRFCKGPP
eukprot:5298046-Lingulodinium_polyedra.AAC.1